MDIRLEIESAFLLDQSHLVHATIPCSLVNAHYAHLLLL
jgi:hypothetical protein